MEIRGGYQDWVNQFRGWVSSGISNHIDNLGRSIVAIAQQLAPVDTGFLRSSIRYNLDWKGIANQTLHITVGAPYGVFQEFGTRNIHPHPFIRPAIEQAGSMTIGTTVHFAAPPAMGRGGVWHGLTAISTAGHETFAGPLRRHLTPRQREHVRSALIPSLRRHNTRRVRAAKMRFHHGGLP